MLACFFRTAKLEQGQPYKRNRLDCPYGFKVSLKVVQDVYVVYLGVIIVLLRVQPTEKRKISQFKISLARDLLFFL